MTKIRTPVLAGNWKLHRGPSATREFFERFTALHLPRTDATVIVFPPAVSIPAAADAVRDRQDIAIGAQNVSAERSGAFTGEISAEMVRDAGGRYVLVGHSERRQLFGETDRDVANKTRAVLGAGLVPVVCVGETLQQRRSGEAERVVLEQLAAALGSFDSAEALVLAYEPVWAIGTGETATPADAQTMHAAIRSALGERGMAKVPVLYGGSVKPDNAAALLAEPDVDGLLVGGASVEPDSFARICAARA